MFRIDIITIFPELFNSYLETSILKRAQSKKKVVFCIHNLRDYTEDKYRTVDDIPYGGGAGMVLKAEPLFKVVSAIKKEYNQKDKTKVVLLTPQGKVFKQSSARSFARKCKHLIFICGRYEGVDERISKIIDEEISIGDYVLSGGELPALIVSEAVVRLLPGVLGNQESVKEDSFSNKYLDYPNYTRPRVFKGLKVPEVLFSGNHKNIKEWRQKQSLLNTYKKRPDLLSVKEKEKIRK